jgi:hypothetical protein
MGSYIGFVQDMYVLSLGPASLTQETLCSNEHNHLIPESLSTSNIQLTFILSLGSQLSLRRLNHALTLLITKHRALRTCLTIASDNNTWSQRVLSLDDKIVPMVIGSKAETIEELEAILLQEETNRNHFDLTTGRVFRCHVIQSSDHNDEDLLLHGDILLFNFHHAIFDDSSKSIFLLDFKRLYSTGMFDIDDDYMPSLIDYALWERNTINGDRSLARNFWEATLNDYENHLQLPYDRRPSMNTCARSVSSVALKLIACPDSAHMTAFQVYLSAYYIFLYKLTQCQDIIIDTRVNNRPRHEFNHTIGLVDTFLPFRFRLEPEESFSSLIERIKQMSVSAMFYASQFNHDSRITKNNLLLDIPVGFQFENIINTIDLTDGCKLVRYKRCRDAKTQDLSLSIEMNECKQLAGALVYANDKFDEATATAMARRFETLLHQLFFLPPSTRICEFSLLLPHEIQLLHHLSNQENINASSNVLPIHQKFASQAEEHPQKLAVILDDQSLTYAEVLHSAQSVAHHLQNEHDIKANDIVAQCIDRSIEMVS